MSTRKASAYGVKLRKVGQPTPCNEANRWQFRIGYDCGESDSKKAKAIESRMTGQLRPIDGVKKAALDGRGALLVVVEIDGRTGKKAQKRRAERLREQCHKMLDANVTPYDCHKIICEIDGNEPLSFEKFHAQLKEEQEAEAMIPASS